MRHSDLQLTDLNPIIQIPLRFIVILLSVLSLAHSLSAQNLVSGIDGGLHIRGTFGLADVSQSGLGPLIQPFVRHQLGRATQGELSVGLGTLRGVDFTTRIIPVDYRVLYYPFSYSEGTLLPKVHLGDIYVFAGAGAVKYTHVEIPRPDDALTADAGPKIRNTTLWNFSDNWAFHVPIGVGAAIHLDDETQLVWNAGYQLTSSQRLSYAPSKGLDGYFAMSVGLKFARPSRLIRKSYNGPVRFVPSISAPMPKIMAVADVIEPASILQELEALAEMPALLRYDILSVFARPEDQASLEIILAHLQRKSDTVLHLDGHTDNQGRTALNEVLSIERAWQAKVWLMREGISKDRIRISGSSSDMPVADNRAVQGRQQNRRVDVRLEPRFMTENDKLSSFAKPKTTSKLKELDAEIEERIIVITPGFRSMQVELTDATMADLDVVSEWLIQYPDIRIHIVGHTDNRGSDKINAFYSLVRASRVQAYLLYKGISMDRMETSGKGSAEPVVPNDSERNRQLNRRIDILRIP